MLQSSNLDSSAGTECQMFLCCPWESILLWADKVEDRHLSYGNTKFESHYAFLNYCISGRCEVCLPDNTYIYMGPGILCIDDHKPKDGCWYPGQNDSGLEIVFDLDRLLGHPIPELSVYCDYDGWIREMLSAHDGTYLGLAGNECERLINLLYSHLMAADWNLPDYRLHLLLLPVDKTAKTQDICTVNIVRSNGYTIYSMIKEVSDA